MSAMQQFDQPTLHPFPSDFDASALRQALKNVTWYSDRSYGTGVCADTTFNHQAVRISLGYAMANRLGDKSAGAHLKEVSYLEVSQIANSNGETVLHRMYIDVSPATNAKNGSDGKLAEHFVNMCARLLEENLEPAKKLRVERKSHTHATLVDEKISNRTSRVMSWRDLLKSEAIAFKSLKVAEGEVTVLVAAPGQAPGEAAFKALKAQLDPIDSPVIAPATGKTQIPLLAAWVKAYQEGWKKVDQSKTFNLDELLGVSSHNRKSFQAFMARHLFDHVNIPDENIHFPTEQTSKTYSQEIANAGHLDLCLGGIGENGHFAFNEPGSAFTSRTRCVHLDHSTRQRMIAEFGSLELTPERAFTIGWADILESASIMMIAGIDKLEILKKMLFGPISENCPSSILRTHPNFLLVLDSDTFDKLAQFECAA